MTMQEGMGKILEEKFLLCCLVLENLVDEALRVA